MVDTGIVVAWESGVDYNISAVPGIKTKFLRAKACS
ncbi:MAG: hypothetical protein SVE93_00800 [Candidatus Thermoplasmatota archaeon]|nr:hypothetical protein [Candidatus Thermoplasmatota archaeon]